MIDPLGSGQRCGLATIAGSAQFEIALESFQKNGFLILVDDKQVDDLNEKIVITETTTVGFIKLLPLVGG